MKKFVQLSLFLVAILFTFTACNEDVPEMEIPRVEKRLKTLTVEHNRKRGVRNLEYQNNKVVKISGYTLFRPDFVDTSYYLFEISYSGNIAEIIYNEKNSYTDYNWEIIEKSVFELDDNNNIIDEKSYDYDADNEVFESSLEWHVKYTYLAGGNLKSINYIIANESDYNFEFDADNLLTKLQEGSVTTNYLNDGNNVISYSADYPNYENVGELKYDDANQLISHTDTEKEGSAIFYAIQNNYEYDNDGLLVSMNDVDVEDGFELLGTAILEYESGYGNIEPFWYYYIDDFAEYFGEYYIHKSLNKGIAKIQ